MKTKESNLFFFNRNLSCLWKTKRQLPLVFFVSELSRDPSSRKQTFERAHPSLNANQVVII
jgi:hypothetical protein